MIAWFARNDVAANLLMITVVMMGGYALTYETAIEIFPSSEPQRIRMAVTVLNLFFSYILKLLVLFILKSLRNSFRVCNF